MPAFVPSSVDAIRPGAVCCRTGRNNSRAPRGAFWGIYMRQPDTSKLAEHYAAILKEVGPIWGVRGCGRHRCAQPRLLSR